MSEKDAEGQFRPQNVEPTQSLPRYAADGFGAARQRPAYRDEDSSASESAVPAFPRLRDYQERQGADRLDPRARLGEPTFSGQATGGLPATEGLPAQAQAGFPGQSADGNAFGQQFGGDFSAQQSMGGHPNGAAVAPASPKRKRHKWSTAALVASTLAGVVLGTTVVETLGEAAVGGVLGYMGAPDIAFMTNPWLVRLALPGALGRAVVAAVLLAMRRVRMTTVLDRE